jgi:hypothetical protein
MKPQATLRRALSDLNLLGATLAGESWRAWRILLIAAMGEPLTEDERTLFVELTGGRPQEPLQHVEEFVALAGTAARAAPLPCRPRTSQGSTAAQAPQPGKRTSGLQERHHRSQRARGPMRSFGRGGAGGSGRGGCNQRVRAVSSWNSHSVSLNMTCCA